MREIVDLSALSEDEIEEVIPSQDDDGFEEISVHRLRRSSTNDVEFVREQPAQHDMPQLGGRGSRDYSIGPSSIFQYFNQNIMSYLQRQHGVQGIDEEDHDLQDPDWDPANQEQLLMPRHVFEHHPFHSLFGPGAYGVHPANPQESGILQRVLAHSMMETSNREQIDIEKIKKPPMPDLSSGYTRNLADEGTFLCPRCNAELGTGDDRKSRIFFRNCGHVYCGSCVDEVAISKSPARRCSAKDCAGKKGVRVSFKQLYF